MTSSPPAISVRGLSKAYRLGVIGRHTLVDELRYGWHKLRGRDPRKHMARIAAGPGEEAATDADGRFWALRDATFDVARGEVVGIVGPNGAGKSTLLKLLTRITEPTEGHAVLEGRVASLLEVGTGFHPELTGRENIFMNGTILGMKRREIAAKFDEIVVFSELERFIDTPVKRYSSGMYVRLAFAVAAHLEPEILLIDEVLAVGDAKFQEKCLGKMSEVAGAGRTILFVSHNLHAVRSLCPRTVLIDRGRVSGPMPTDDALHRYAGHAEEGLRARWHADKPKGVADVFLAQNGRAATLIGMSQPFEIGLKLADAVVNEPCHMTVQITNDRFEVVHHSGDMFEPAHYNEWRRGHRHVTVPAHALAPGRYGLSFWIWRESAGLIEERLNVLSWEVAADEAVFARYAPQLWKGVTGPALLDWTCRGTLEIPPPVAEEGGP